jgi:exportin-1
MAHWKFLKTVVLKLFEFMHEVFPGVQDMACDTFLKISKKCKKKFVIEHQDDENNFLEKLLSDIPNIISKLESSHIHVFYETLGYIIDSADHRVKEDLIKKLMDLPNKRWKSIMKGASSNIQVLTSNETMRDLINLLKTNVASAKSLKSSFHYQLSLIFKDMLSIYQAYSQMITQELQKNSEASGFTHVRNMKKVKREILRLFEIFVLNSEDVNTLSKLFVPSILESTLGKIYNSSIGMK